MQNNKYSLPDNPKLRDGMRVPDGYFDTFAAKMSASLPVNEHFENQTATPPHKRTLWQKSRAYVYMAAMFAGVWCMTKMFSLMKENGTSLSVDNNPVLAAALTNNDFVDNYVYASIDEYDILNDLYEDGVDINDYNP